MGGAVVLAGGGGFFPGALNVLIEIGVVSSVLANTCEGPKTATTNAVTKIPVIIHKGLLFTFLPPVFLLMMRYHTLYSHQTLVNVYSPHTIRTHCRRR